MHTLKHLHNPSAPVDVDALTETVGRLVDLVGEHGFHYLDLTTVTPSTVNGEHLAAVLRITSSNRILVKGWNHALQVARVALHQQGVNVADVLFGIDD
jgi:hypothetical protein